MMRALAELLRVAVESRLIVGAAAAALTVATSRILGVPVSGALLATVMAATIVIYGLDRVLDRRSEPGPLPRTTVASTAGATVALFALLTALRSETVLAIAVGLPACILYAVPLGRGGDRSERRRPKDHPLGKALYVATAVTGATVLLPLLESGRPPSPVALTTAIAWVFTVLLANAVACDLRDEEPDRRAGLETIATRTGTERTRAQLVIALLLLGSTSAAAVIGAWIPPVCLAVIALALVAVARLRAHHPRWVWGLCLDGAFLPLLLLGWS